MSADAAPAETTQKTLRIGSFIAARESEQGARTSPIPVIGAEETAFAGKPGLAHWQQIGPTPDAIAEAEVKLAKLRHLSHPALAPVIESGLNKTVAWWIEAVPPGRMLADAVRDDASLSSIPSVRRLVEVVSGVLALTHEVGLSHGSISGKSIAIGSNGAPVLTGLGIGGKGFTQDQADLALLVINLLESEPWNEQAADPLRRADQLREHLGNYTDRISGVLARATHPDPAERYSSIADFAKQFGEAVQFSGEDLVQAGQDAISSQNAELAKLLAEKAAAYDPNSDALANLNHRLRGGLPLATNGAQAMSNLDSPIPALPGTPSGLTPVDPAANMRNQLPPELTEGLPQELIDLIAPQFEVKPVKKGVPPLLVMIVGFVGIAFLLALARMVTLLITGN
jgi:hypothetical protein